MRPRHPRERRPWRTMVRLARACGEAQQLREGLLGLRSTVAPHQRGKGVAVLRLTPAMAMDEEAGGGGRRGALDQRQHGRDVIPLRTVLDAGFGIAEAHDQRVAAGGSWA